MTNAVPSKALAALEIAPVHGLLTASSQAAVGCGIGMIVAGKFNRASTRQTTGIALLSLGLLANVPSVVEWVVRLLNRPESERGANRRLRSIRGDLDAPGFEPENELF